MVCYCCGVDLVCLLFVSLICVLLGFTILLLLVLGCGLYGGSGLSCLDLALCWFTLILVDLV